MAARGGYDRRQQDEAAIAACDNKYLETLVTLYIAAIEVVRNLNRSFTAIPPSRSVVQTSLDL